ncbi:MAG: DUF1217 domain-containing protein [Roseovarius sp.]|nr:DUF1217 domain-containing protein [Roseovarius sp.]
MMFRPVLPLAGLPGWNLLNRTLDTQRAAFDAAPEIQRDTDYFEARIGSVRTAEELVADRRLLRVALGAFGLQDDIDSRYLIRKVLEGGTESPDALANRLSDDRYRQLSAAFGLGGGSAAPRSAGAGFGADIAARFRERSFEVAVGEQDQSLRLAMNAARDLTDLGTDDASDDTRWYRILGTPPLRSVFETALGLPDGIVQMDIDRQLDIFRQAARDRLGIDSLDAFADAQARDRLVETYLLRDQIKAGGSLSPQGIALTLLQAGRG